MLNKVILQGRLVVDPELMHTQNGTAVAAFRIAVDRDFKSKDPTAQNADFISIVAWRQTAEFISRYFVKGTMILIDGRLQTRSYTDYNEQRRSVTEVVAESVHFTVSKRENSGGNNQSGGYNAPKNEPQQAQYAQPGELVEVDEDDGELPF